MKPIFYVTSFALSLMIVSCGGLQTSAQPSLPLSESRDDIQTFIQGGIFQNDSKSIQVAFDFQPDASVGNEIQYLNSVSYVQTQSKSPHSLSFVGSSLPPPFEISWTVNFNENSVASGDRKLVLKRVGCVAATCLLGHKYKVAYTSDRCQLVFPGVKTRTCE